MINFFDAEMFLNKIEYIYMAYINLLWPLNIIQRWGGVAQLFTPYIKLAINGCRD